LPIRKLFLQAISSFNLIQLGQFPRLGEHFPGALFGLILRRLDRDADFDRQNERKAGYSPIPHHRSETHSDRCKMVPTTGISLSR